jgi:hypothetical protein
MTRRERISIRLNLSAPEGATPANISAALDSCAQRIRQHPSIPAAQPLQGTVGGVTYRLTRARQPTMVLQAGPEGMKIAEAMIVKVGETLADVPDLTRADQDTIRRIVAHALLTGDLLPRPGAAPAHDGGGNGGGLFGSLMRNWLREIFSEADDEEVNDADAAMADAIQAALEGATGGRRGSRMRLSAKQALVLASWIDSGRDAEAIELIDVEEMRAADILPLPEDPDAVEARQGDSYSIIYSDGRLELLGA